VRAEWRLGDGSILTVAANLGAKALPCEKSSGQLIAAAGPEALEGGILPAFSAFVWLKSQ
jgi:hypothetical protein